jgi:hypothetical protein
VNIAISVSGLELVEKLNSIFHIDISNFIVFWKNGFLKNKEFLKIWISLEYGCRYGYGYKYGYGY